MRKKVKEVKPEYGLEYVFRFWNETTKQATQWNFIYDGIQPNGRYAFFKRQGGGIVTLDPRRFNWIMKNNLIETRVVPMPKSVDYKVKLLEQDRQRKLQEVRKQKEEADAWGREVLAKFEGLNVFQQAEVSQRLSMPFETFLSDVKKFVGNEGLNSVFIEKTFKNILSAAKALDIKLKALI